MTFVRLSLESFLSVIPYMCDLPSKEDWLPGTITRAMGPLSFEIQLFNGRTVRRHSDHLRPRTGDMFAQPPSRDWTDFPDPPPVPDPVLPQSPRSVPLRQDPVLSPPQSPPPIPLRRSSRVSARPDRLIEHASFKSYGVICLPRAAPASKSFFPHGISFHASVKPIATF